MARHPRFFISPGQVSENFIRITGEDVRHIATVLRMKAGEELVLCDGQGTDYSVRIRTADRNEIVTEIGGRTMRAIPYPRVVLGQGLPKSDKMDFIVQKATELGAAAVAPLITERTIVKPKDEQKRTARWRKIAREAAMQSNRPDIPGIGPIRKFSEYVASFVPDPDTLLLLPWEEGTRPIKDVLTTNKQARNVVVLIGPEGGFSAAEAELAHRQGFHPVSLGPNILRTETAAVAVLSMIGYEFSAQ